MSTNEIRNHRSNVDFGLLDGLTFEQFKKLENANDINDFLYDAFLFKYFFKNIDPRIVSNINKKEQLFYKIGPNDETVIELFFNYLVKNDNAKKYISSELSKYAAGLNVESFNLADFFNKLFAMDYLDDDIIEQILFRKNPFVNDYILCSYFDMYLFVLKDVKEAEDNLFTKVYNNKTELDIMLENNYESAKVNEFAKKSRKIANEFMMKNKYKPLMDADDEFLTRIGSYEEDTILDHYFFALMSSKLFLSSSHIDIDYLPKNQSLLLRKAPNDDRTYFDIFLEECYEYDKTDVLFKFDFEPELLLHYSNKIKSGWLFWELPRLNKDLAFSMFERKCKDRPDFWLNVVMSEETVLELLLNEDKDKTVNIIRGSKTLRRNPKVITLLKLCGVNLEFEPYLEASRKDFYSVLECVDEYYYKDSVNKELDLDYYKNRIEEFRKIMMSDNRSDKEAVDLACNAIKSLYNRKFYIEAENYIESLINIKRNDSIFSLKYYPLHNVMDNNSTSHFNPKEKAIYFTNCESITTFYHEATHAIHFYYNGNKIPKDVKDKIVISNDILNRYLIWKRKTDKIRSESIPDDEILNSFSIWIHNYFNMYTNYYKNKCDEFYNKTQEDVKEMCEYYGFCGNATEILEEGLFDKDEFFEYYLSDKIKRSYLLLDYKMYQDKASISDLIDAISGGRITTDVNNLGENEEFGLGHGEEYYKNDFFNNLAFTEIIALFEEINKSINTETRDELKEIIGEDLYDELNRFRLFMKIGPDGKGIIDTKTEREDLKHGFEI